jgi:FkbM family methyltransferase
MAEVALPKPGLARRAAALVRSIWRHPANRNRRCRAVMTFFVWQIGKRISKRPRAIAFHGAKLMCYPDSTSTSASLYYGGYADYWEMKFIRAYLRPGDHFLDIGANCGVYSVMAADCVGKGGSVDAFEPMEGAARRIEEQARLNAFENVRVHRLAVGARDEFVDFGFSSNDAMMHLRRPAERDHGAIQVKSVRLDGFQSYGHYAMGKMDIEGAEALALQGASQRLRDSNPPVWLLELAGHSNHYGTSSSGIIAHLEERGYDCAIFDSGRGSVRYTNEPWAHGALNALFIARSHRECVEARLSERAAGSR